MVNPHPADGKNSVLFQEVSAVRHYMAKGISNGAVGGAEKSAEAIVADLGGEGPNQSTDAGNGIAWAGREGKETSMAR